MNGWLQHGRAIGVRRLFATALWLVSFFACQAQLDTSFWFVAPEVCQWNNPTNFDRPVKLVFSTPGNVPATVTITQPANPAFTPIHQNVPANGSATVDLTSHIADIENAPANTVLNKGLHISSTQPVNAYYEVCMTGLTPEVYALKGRNALGTNFFVPGQNEYMNGGTYQPTPLNRVDVVATRDNTVVTFKPRVAIEGHAAGAPFSITLNKGQTYCYAAVGRQPANHFEGSTITSNNPIAVTVSDDLLHHPSGGQDLVGDQTVPVGQAGLEFVAIKGDLYQQADKVYITATESNTHIYVNGSTTAAATLSAGQTHPIMFGSNSSTLYITSDRPVYAFQLTGLGHEFGSAVLPSIQNTGSTQVSYKRSTGANRQMTFNLIARAGTEGNFTLNGNTAAIQASDFHPVAGTNGGWVYASLDIPTSLVDVNQTAVVLNPAPFHLGVFEGGYAGGCSYGFFSDYLPVTIDTCLKDTTLLQDTITYGYLYQENGFYIPCDESTRIGLNTYEQLLSNADGCDSLVLLHLVVLCPESNHSNVITPSVQDGINDYFMPFGENSTPFGDIEIYNRWGKKVYSSHITSSCFWDGKINGAVVKGVFYYAIQLPNGCVYHGSLTVL